MNSMLLNIIIQTMPKVDANRYEEGRLIVKSRKKWQSDYITGFLLCKKVFLVSGRKIYYNRGESR